MTAPAPPERVCFLHIAKTAGTTVRSFLESGFRAADVCPAASWPDLLALDPDQLHAFRLFRGEFGALVLDRLPQPVAAITMLRDPVARVVSHWRHLRRHAENPAHAEVMRQGPSLRAFVLSRTPNVQTRHLAAQAGPPELFASLRAAPSRRVAFARFEAWTAAQPDLLDRALDQLDRLFAFGVVERLEDAIRLFAARLQWAPPIGVAALNVAPPWQDRYELSPGEVALIQERDALDVELHARASQIFERQFAAEALVAGRTYERRLAARARPLDGEFVVDFGDPVAGTGWLPPQRHAHRWMRWMRGEVATVDVPLRLPEDARVEVNCAAVAGQRQSSGWTLDVNGIHVPLTRAGTSSGGAVYAGAVPGRARGTGSSPFTRLTFRVTETVPYNITGRHAYDALRLGIAVSGIRLVARPRAVPASAPAGGPDRLPPVNRDLVAVRTVTATKLRRAPREPAVATVAGAVATGSPRVTLARLVAPLSVDEFLLHYFGRRPVYLPGCRARGEGLMSLDDLVGALAAGIRGGGLLTDPAEDLPVGPLHGPERAARTWRYLAAGYPLIWSRARGASPAVDATVAALAAELGAEVWATVCTTSPRSTPFDVHFDPHESIVVQCAGRKTWWVSEFRVPLDAPTTDDEVAALIVDGREAARARPMLRITLGPGDAIYVPRGLFHNAWAVGGRSLHVNFFMGTHAVA